MADGAQQSSPRATDALNSLPAPASYASQARAAGEAALRQQRWRPCVGVCSSAGPLRPLSLTPGPLRRGHHARALSPRLLLSAAAAAAAIATASVAATATSAKIGPTAPAAARGVALGRAALVALVAPGKVVVAAGGAGPVACGRRPAGRSSRRSLAGSYPRRHARCPTGIPPLASGGNEEAGAPSRVWKRPPPAPPPPPPPYPPPP